MIMLIMVGILSIVNMFSIFAAVFMISHRQYSILLITVCVIGFVGSGIVLIIDIAYVTIVRMSKYNWVNQFIKLRNRRK